MSTVNNSLLKQEKNKKTVFDLIQSSKEQFAMALPKHISTDRFTRVALTAVRQNPKLQECSVPSLLGVFMTLAQLGLEPGVLGQAYILPFNNKNKGQTNMARTIERANLSFPSSDILPPVNMISVPSLAVTLLI